VLSRRSLRRQDAFYDQVVPALGVGTAVPAELDQGEFQVLFNRDASGRGFLLQYPSRGICKIRRQGHRGSVRAQLWPQIL
jgi:hypothetical protein